MKKSARKILTLALALALVCGLAVSGLAITIGDTTFYHEYVLVEHYLTLLERRASADVVIEDTYGGIDMSNTGTITLQYSYYDATTRSFKSASKYTTRLYETGASVLVTFTASSGNYLTSATGSYDISLDICGTPYRHHPRDLTLTEEDYR